MFCRHRLALCTPLLALGLAACQRPEDVAAPADLLPRPALIGLMADLHVLEARIENSRLSPDSARALFAEQKQALLWQRQVPDSTFQRSYRYYSVHNKDLLEIYQAVIDTLKRREARFAPAPGTPAPPPHR